MHILDTDHLSILDQDTLEAFTLGRRLAALPNDELFVTIITFPRFQTSPSDSVQSAHGEFQTMPWSVL